MMKFELFFTRMLLLVTAWLGAIATGSVLAQTTTIIVRPNDQVGSIAQRYLTAPAANHWKKIIELNRLPSPYVLQPGQSLLLPTEHLASQLAQAQLVRLSGSVQVIRASGAATPAIAAMALTEGDRVVTQEGSSAVVQLTDGSVVTILPESNLLLAEHRYYLGRTGTAGAESSTGTRGFSSLLRLLQGSIETNAKSAGDRAKPLRIETPTSVVGVRGTAFRVTHDAVNKDLETRIEVTQGLVQAELDPKRQAAVESGFGVLMDPASSEAPKPVLLLDAPALQTWAKRYERPTIELAPLPQLQGQQAIRGYRVQMAKISDPLQSAFAEMKDIAVDRRFLALAPIQISNLTDGVWQVRTRAIDPSGIEGKDAYALITLKARPLPPIIQAPSDQAKLTQKQGAQLVWASSLEATAYQLEVLHPSGERKVYASNAATYHLKELLPGGYQWRLATQKGTDQGPWSDPQHFTVVADPPPASSVVDPTDRTLLLRWSDLKAARYDIQLAREKSFPSETTQMQQSYRPHTAFMNPESGQYFVRYRAIDPTGFVGDWSDVMEVTVPPDWKHLLIYLGGGLTQWP